MTTATATSAQQVTVILNSPNNWDEWIKIVKAKARAGMIWEFMNLSIEKGALPTFTRSTIPTASQINAEKTTVAALYDAGKEQYKALVFNYKKQLSSYKQKKIALLS